MLNALAKNEFILVTLIAMVLIAVPFMVTDWLPMTDLPHHLSQAHLLAKVLAGNQPDMVVNWLAPNTLTTWLLACMLSVLPPLTVAKTLVLCLLLMSILGVALLAKKIGASPVTVPLSAALLLNQSFYWGFLPFIAGFAAFLFLVTAWTSLTRFSWWALIFLALLFLLVYFSHIFWFAIAILTVALIALDSPDRNIKLRTMILAVLPAVGLTLFWYPSMHNKWMNAGFDMAPYWISSLAVRLRPDYAAFAISGLKSDFNLLLLLTTFLFVLFGMVRAMVRGGRFVSVPLFGLAIALLVAYLSMPDKYNNAILFAVRWLPYALIFFLLGCLAPVQAAKWRIGILLLGCMALGGYAFLTAYTWNSMEKEELSGLQQALEKLPAKQNVMGLDFIRESVLINTENPFATNAAYAQVFKDSEVNFSFAEHASSLVTYKTKPVRPYKSNLSYYSQLVSRKDVGYFNYVLVNADEVTHGKLALFLGITPVTHEGRWRLYYVGRHG